MGMLANKTRPRGKTKVVNESELEAEKMGRVCLLLTIVSLLCGYCSTQQDCSRVSRPVPSTCCDWSTQPYQNSTTGITSLADLTSPLGFLNTDLLTSQSITDTTCLNVDVPGASSDNYVFVAVEVTGSAICIRFEDTAMEECSSDTVFLCSRLAGSSVQVTFSCNDESGGCDNDQDIFFFYKVETIALDQNDEDAWCDSRNREVPSSLRANIANENIDVTLATTTEDNSALGLGITLLLLPVLLMGVLLQPY